MKNHLKLFIVMDVVLLFFWVGMVIWDVYLDQPRHIVSDSLFLVVMVVFLTVNYKALKRQKASAKGERP